MIAISDSTPSSLFFRIAAAPSPRDLNWAQRDLRGMDWNALIGLALIENSITVLQTQIASLPAGSVAPKIRSQIDRLAMVWTFKLTHLKARLAEAIEVLAAADIEVTLLKGAALALSTYPRFADRPMADLDLMVDPGVADAAHEILQHAGWQIETASLEPDSWQDHHHLPPLADTTGSGLRLELHTAPLTPGHPFRFTSRDINESAKRIQIGSAHALVPEIHHHAVHAAIHFAYSHQFLSGRLNFFRDLSALTSRPDWSWDRFTDIATGSASQPACYWALRLARAVTGQAVPSAVLEKLSPQLGDRISSVLEKHFTQLVLRAEHSCPSVELRHRLWAFALRLPDSTGRTSQAWLPPSHSGAQTRQHSRLRHLGTHLRRAPRWSRYVASLIAPALEMMA